MIRDRIQNEANDVWAALSILDEITNAKYISLDLSSRALPLKSIPIQIPSNEEDFTFLFGLAVCHLRCSLRLIRSEFREKRTGGVSSETERRSTWAKETGGSGNYEET